METKFVGDHLSRRIDFIGIVCPGGQEVRDWKYGDQMGSGPNASQPMDYEFFLKQQINKQDSFWFVRKFEFEIPSWIQ